MVMEEAAETYQVYAVRCIKNGKIYIGCTKSGNLIQRFTTHLQELRNQRKTVSIGKIGRGPSAWQKDYNKYGVNAFEFFLVEDDIPAELKADRENYWINEYRSCEQEYGYNIRRNNPVVPITYKRELPPKIFSESTEEKS